jgi:hypothetical protein
MAVMNMDTLAKILAKAENTDNEAEYEAFMARAVQMSAAMGIELDLARAHQASKYTQAPEERQYEVGAWNSRYNGWMVKLFLAIAAAHDLRCTISGSNIYVWGMGYPADHEIVNALYSIASVRMVSDADKALKRGDHKAEYTRYDGEKVKYSRVDGRVWRANFYKGYIATLQARLWAEKSKAQAEAEEARKKAKEEAGEFESPFFEDETDSVAMVLAEKADQVEDAFKQKHSHWYHPDGTFKKNVPTFGGPTTSLTAYDAQSAGSTSARNTDLHTSKKVKQGARGALEG